LKPSAGVLIELSALAAVLWLSFFIPKGLPFLLFVVVAESLSTYLVHCPAHYLVGGVVGIRFTEMKVGRTTLSRAIPSPLARFSRLLAVPTLVVDRQSLVSVPPRRRAAMYASGTVASVASAFVVAALATPSVPILTSAVAWVVAIGYLAFDAVFSPRTGDLGRAKRALSG
jgi:hypothetical protein